MRFNVKLLEAYNIRPAASNNFTARKNRNCTLTVVKQRRLNSFSIFDMYPLQI